MTSNDEVIRQEYIDALDAFRAATKRLHIARQAYNTLPKPGASLPGVLNNDTAHIDV